MLSLIFAMSVFAAGGEVMADGAPVEGSLVSMKTSLTKAVNLGKGFLAKRDIATLLKALQPDVPDADWDKLNQEAEVQRGEDSSAGDGSYMKFVEYSSAENKGSRARYDSQPYSDARPTLEQTSKRNSVNMGHQGYGLSLDNNQQSTQPHLNRNSSTAGLPHSHFHPPEIESEALSSQHQQSVEIIN